MFLVLPVDTRLRCSEVSRAWRALLADATFFARLDLSISSGLARYSLPLFRAALAKAGGQLRSLNITGQILEPHLSRLLVAAVREAVASSAATLTELRVDVAPLLGSGDVLALAEAAPALHFLQASTWINEDHQVTRAMLRNEPPFQALQLRRLNIVGGMDTTEDVILLTSFRLALSRVS